MNFGTQQLASVIKPWPVPSGQQGGPLVPAILLGNIAMRVGEGFDWNATNLKSSNPKATALATKDYRKGWEI